MSPTSSDVLDPVLMNLGRQLPHISANDSVFLRERSGQAKAIAKNTVCLWYDNDAESSVRFCATILPNISIASIHRAPSDNPSGKARDVLTVEFSAAVIRCIGLNGGPAF